jgi:hypothetical protein
MLVEPVPGHRLSLQMREAVLCFRCTRIAPPAFTLASTRTVKGIVRSVRVVVAHFRFFAIRLAFHQEM